MIQKLKIIKISFNKKLNTTKIQKDYLSYKFN